MLKRNRKIIIIEIIIGAVVLLCSYMLSGHYDVLEKLTEWASKHEEYEIDELISNSIVLVLLSLVFAVRRYQESRKKTKELQRALDEIKTLQGVLPICAYCKKIRDDEGSWKQLESYIRNHSSAEFSHGICPTCYKEQLNKLDEDKKKKDG